MGDRATECGHFPSLSKTSVKKPPAVLIILSHSGDEVGKGVSEISEMWAKGRVFISLSASPPALITQLLSTFMQLGFVHGDCIRWVRLQKRMALRMLVPLGGTQPDPRKISSLSQEAQSSSRTQESLVNPVFAAMLLWFTPSRKEGRE